MDSIENFDYVVITVETTNKTYISIPIEINDINSDYVTKLLDNPTQFNFIRFNIGKNEHVILSNLIIKNSIIKLKFLNMSDLYFENN
jgi:hypothetical protein